MKQPRPDTKAAAILRALRRASGLTTMQAFLLGDTCLPSTVHQLRRAGHVIDGIWQQGRSRYGGRPTRFKKYRIRLQPQK